MIMTSLTTKWLMYLKPVPSSIRNNEKWSFSFKEQSAFIGRKMAKRSVWLKTGFSLYMKFLLNRNKEILRLGLLKKSGRR